MDVSQLAAPAKNDPKLYERLQREDARRVAGGPGVVSSGHRFDDAQFALRNPAGVLFPGTPEGTAAVPLHARPTGWKELP